MGTTERPSGPAAHQPPMTPSASPAGPTGHDDAIGPILAELGRELDSLLERMPDNKLEARRLITRELHFEPRAEELQTIVKIATDPTPQGGVRRELPRRLLLVRLLANRELKQLHDARRLDAATIEQSARILPQLSAEIRQVEDDLRNALAAEASLTVDDRQLLLRVGDAFACPKDEMVTAIVLARRLALLARAAEAGDLSVVAPSLTEHEAKIVTNAVHGVDDELGDWPTRVCVDAVALRSLIQEDLDGWSRLPAWSESDEQQRAAREALLERVKLDKVACGVVSERLQRQQDAALVAGLNGFAEELRGIARSLFSTSLKLAPILRDPYADPQDDAAVDQNPDSVRELLEECSTADAAAEKAQAEKTTTEEVYLNALKDVRPLPTPAPAIDTRARKRERERRRLKWLLGATAVLAVASAAVHLMLPSRPPLPPDLSLEDLSATTNVTKVRTAGPMLLTHVEGWRNLDERSRIGKVQELGLEASKRGFDQVYVLDDVGMFAAQWSRKGGVKLAEAPTRR